MNAVLPDPREHDAKAHWVRQKFGNFLLGLASPVFHRALDRIDAGLQHGSIEATLPTGQRRLLGGRTAGPTAIVDIASWRALIRLASGGSAGWYIAWTKGEWFSPDPVVLFDLFMRNARSLGDAGRAGGIGRLIRRLWHWQQRNSRAGSRRNVAQHYDLGNDFYVEWLDPTLSYSSAMFAQPVTAAETLEAAQRRKLAAMLDRTATRGGDRILEIGCGWGSFARVASAEGRRVHGITLSEEQCRALSQAGLPGVDVSLTDYRDVDGVYDAVVSIEMVEAVGQAYWSVYLAAIARALKPGGRAAIQYIAIDDAIFDRYARNVDFIQAFIFPGGMLLSESRFRALAESHGLEWRDRVGFGQDYAETLRRWRTQFDAAVAQNRLPRRFDRDFVALWRYYMMYCEGGFRGGGIDVAQVTLVKRG
ncbi:MAG: cyclopropane-fatty-acyl-phospholipid synthase family protein [Sphingomonas sp.]|nr:cyclopropane-fatty-acyl-phospholipid synthase family protein [Sphingomonas sp.]